VRYVDIRTVGSEAFQVWACRDGTDTVVMVDRATGKFDLNRRAVGLPVRKGYRPPALSPGTFTREEAASVAHQIGRYVFKLGDLVYSYTTVDGLNNPDFFERT
jgi:hypothetical protein